MILDKQVWVSLSGNNIKYYKDLGYNIPLQPAGGTRKDRMSVKRGTKILVNIQDLQEGSKAMVNVQCDYCGEVFTRQYYLIVKGRKNNLKDSCGKTTCRCIKSGKSRQKDFSEVLKAFDDRGYTLLTTPDEVCCLSTHPLKYTCPIHGEHVITWNSFIKGAGCIECGIERNKLKLKEYTWDRIQNAFNNSEYKLLSEFKEYTCATDACLRCWCDKHGEFYVSWANFQRYCGCPTCGSSMGERSIKHYLDENNIQYDKPKRFNGLVGVGGKLLSYDFYLPDYNLLIEYQGIQHEKPRDFGRVSESKAYKNFLKQQEHDMRKRVFAENNGYSLLEIWYYDFYNISDILKKILTIQN